MQETAALVIPKAVKVLPTDWHLQVKYWAPNRDFDELRRTQRELAALCAFMADQRNERFQGEAGMRWVEVGIGKLLGAVEQGERTNPGLSVAADSDLTKDERYEYRLMAEHEDIVEACIDEGKATRASILAAIKLAQIGSREVEPPTGEYDVIVIDPPWPMEKIERDVRPNQARFEYPTKPEEWLAALVLPTAEDCHVWVWTTVRFLPMAFRLLEAWGLKYVCPFVWHKPGGFQPVGLPQYNCELALYARRGSPQFVDTKDLPLCFEAPRGAHSEKPEAFYGMVRRVTAGRRLDMFNRREIEGFDGWGNEAPR